MTCTCQELPKGASEPGATFTICGSQCRRIDQHRARILNDKNRHPIWQLLDQLQMDARAHAAKLVEIRSYVANLALPESHLHFCPECQTSHRHAHSLAEHRYVCHDGPVPEHYLAAERLAGEPA